MVVKFGMQQSRGAAGQSSVGGPKRNFANLYGMNRADDQINAKAGQFAGKANAIKGTAQQANTSNIQGRMSGQGAMGQMASAVKDAKGLSNQAQNFSPATQMMKTGASPYQAGIGSFYAGGKGSTGAQQIRKFGGLYGQMMGKESDMQQRLASQGSSGVPIQAALSQQGAWKNPYNTAQHESGQVDKANQAGRAGRNQTDINRMSNLDWAVKTGRITQEQSYRAQKDPAYYQQISTWLNKGG